MHSVRCIKASTSQSLLLLASEIKDIIDFFISLIVVVACKVLFVDSSTSFGSTGFLPAAIRSSAKSVTGSTICSPSNSSDSSSDTKNSPKSSVTVPSGDNSIPWAPDASALGSLSSVTRSNNMLSSSLSSASSASSSSNCFSINRLIFGVIASIIAFFALLSATCLSCSRSTRASSYNVLDINNTH